jgi:FKBP-type peptidyl-prolyl cis-trans isomerase
MKKIFSVALAIVVLVVACNKPQATVEKPLMQNSAASMSYVIGLNLGANLIGIDSLLNVEAVCAGLRDAYVAEAKLNPEEARAAYLKYLNYDIYERVDAFEKQFLADLRKEDRKFVATSTGLTYKVHTLGDMKKVVRNNRDTILVRYRALNVAGEIVDTTYLNADTLRIAVGEMPRGVIEASKLIGEGGKINLWIPPHLGYSTQSRGKIKANDALVFEVELHQVNTVEMQGRK